MIPGLVPCCCNKIPDRSKGRVNFGLQSERVIYNGGEFPMEHIAAGHTRSRSHCAHRQEAVGCDSAHSPLSFSSGPHPTVRRCPGLGWEDPPYKPNWTARYTHAQRSVSMMTLNPSKLPIELNPHSPNLINYFTLARVINLPGPKI